MCKSRGHGNRLGENWIHRCARKGFPDGGGGGGGWLLIAQKVPRGHSHRCRPSDGNRDTWLPHLGFSGLPTPQFLEVAAPPPACALSFSSINANAGSSCVPNAHSCCFIRPHQCRGVPDVHRAPGGRVQEENTPSLPHAACAPPEGGTRQKTVGAGEEGPGAWMPKTGGTTQSPPFPESILNVEAVRQVTALGFTWGSRLALLRTGLSPEAGGCFPTLFC